MRELLFLLLAILFLGITLSTSSFFETTRFGEKQESFEILNSKYIPFVLKNYLAERHIRYYVYNIPNYIEDFFIYNKDFKSISENRSSKFSIILFAPVSNDVMFSNFANSLETSIKDYVEFFNIVYVYKDNLDKVYIDSNDNKAFLDLSKHCKTFCLVDLENKTMFTFKNITNTEVMALPALIQQYAFMKK